MCGNDNDANAGIHLKHVDVEVDGRVEGGEQVGDAGDIFHPGGPDHLLIVNIGNIVKNTVERSQFDYACYELSALRTHLHISP